MGSIRQEKVSGIIKKELAIIFQRNANELCLGSMVTPTVVRVTSDLSLARVYLSVFAADDPQEVIDFIDQHKGLIKKEVGRKLKNFRKIPDLLFKIDDSLDYANEIDELLKS